MNLIERALLSDLFFNQNHAAYEAIDRGVDGEEDIDAVSIYDLEREAIKASAEEFHSAYADIIPLLAEWTADDLVNDFFRRA